MSAIHSHGQYAYADQPLLHAGQLHVDQLRESLKKPDDVKNNDLGQYVACLLYHLSGNFDREKQQLLLKFISIFFRRLDASTKVLLLSEAAKYYPTDDPIHTGILIRALRYSQEHQLPHSDLLRQINDIEKQFLDRSCEIILESVTVQLIALQWRNQPHGRAREWLGQIKQWEGVCKNAALTLAETVLTIISPIDNAWKEINAFVESYKNGLPHAVRSLETCEFIFAQYLQIAKQSVAESFGDPIAFSQKAADCLKFADFLLSLGQVKWAEGILRDLRNLVVSRDPVHQSIQAIDALLRSRPDRSAYRFQWCCFRDQFHMLKKNASNCGNFTDGYVSLLKAIMGYVHGLIGQYAPSQYTPLIFGSHIRREAVPFSDNDIAFLIADQSKQVLFAAHFLPAFIPLVRFYLQCLDDYWIVAPDGKNAVTISVIGGDIDEGNLEVYVRSKPILVNSPDQMVAWMGKKEDDYPEYRYGLFFAQPLFEASPLYTHFRSLVKGIWHDESHRREISNYFCHWNIRMFPHRHIPEANLNYLEYLPHVKNLKKGWIGPFTLFCFDVAINEGYEEVFQIEHILAQFEERKLFPPYFIQALRKAWQTLHEIRWKKLSEVPNEPHRGGPYAVWVKPCTIENPLHCVLLPSLAPEENEALTTIEQQVLIPAYAALEKIHKTGHCLDPLLAICQTALAHLPDFQSRAIHAQMLIAQLKRRQIPINVLNGLQMIKPTPPRTERIPLSKDLHDWLVENYSECPAEQRFVWLTTLLEIEPLFYWITGEDLIHLVEDLVCTPTLDGQRIAQDLDLWLFCERIKPFFEAQGHENFCSITLPNLDDPFSQHVQRYHFKKDARQQFLKDNGQFVDYKSESPSLHTAIPLTINGKLVAWIKACPENSSIELLARELAWGVGDGGMPASLPGKLQRVPRNNVAGDTLSVLILDHVWGISLTKAGEHIHDISPASSTQTAIIVAIGCPWDDKPEDYRLQNGRLMRLDNECMFGPPVQKGLLGNEATLRSVIPFLDQMKGLLDEKTLKRFRQTNPQDLGKRLLDRLEQIHLFFSASDSGATMFSSRDVERHFENWAEIQKSWNIKIPGPSLLSVVVTKQWVISLLHYLESVHRACQTSELTGMDLFKVVHPELWDIYKKSWEAKLPGRTLACLERLDKQDFFKKDAQGYRSSKVASFAFLSKAQGYSNLKRGTLLATFGKREMVLNGEEGKTASFISVKTLIDDYTKRAYDDMCANFTNEDPAFVKAFQAQFAYKQSAFLDQISKSPITENQQRLILQALPGVRSTFHHPDLSYLGKVITSKALSSIFRAHGKRCLSLTLRHCSTLNDVNSIDDSCPSLTRLVLEELPIQSVRFSKMQGLTHVLIRRCPKLQRVVIQSPILQTLDLSDSSEVAVIETKSSHLRHLSIKGCPNLTLEQVKLLLANPYIFEKFECDTRHLSHPKRQIIARYPFLLRWGSLPLWLISRFASALQAMERHKPIKSLSENQQNELARLLDALVYSCQKQKELPSDIKIYELDKTNESFVELMRKLKSENVTHRKAAINIIGGLVLESHVRCDSFFRIAREPMESFGITDIYEYIEQTSKETDPNIKKILLKQRLIWLASGLLHSKGFRLPFDYTKIPDDIIYQESEMNHNYQLLKQYREKIQYNRNADISSWSWIESCISESMFFGEVEKPLLDAFVDAEKHDEGHIRLMMRFAFISSNKGIKSRIEVCQTLIQLILKKRTIEVLQEFEIVKNGLNDENREIRLATSTYLQTLYPACREELKKSIAETIESKTEQEKDKRVQASFLVTLKLYDQTKKDLDVFDHLYANESDISENNIQEICAIIQQAGEKQKIRYIPLRLRTVLLRGVASKNPEIGLAAVKALGVAEVNDRPEIEVLLFAYYQNADSEVRKGALNVLAKPRAFPWLLNALIHDNKTIQSAAIEASFQFNLLDKADLLQAFVLSICKLNERNPVPYDIYAAAIWILMRRVKQENNGLELFIALLEKYPLTESASIADLAADILESIIPKETLQKWLPRLSHLTMRFASVFTVTRLSQLLGHFAHQNKEVVTSIKQSLQDRDQRTVALEVLWGMQKTYPAAAEILREASEEINHELQKKAKQWLRKPISLPPKKNDMTPIENKRWISQQELLPSGHSDLVLEPNAQGSWLDKLFYLEGLTHIVDRMYYRQGVAYVGTGQPIQFLASFLKDDNCWIRLTAAETIFTYKHQRAEAVDAGLAVKAMDILVSLVQKGENSVREAALHVLHQISERKLMTREDYKRISQMLKLGDSAIALSIARFFLRAPYPLILLEGIAQTSQSFCDAVYNILTERDFSLHPCYQYADKFHDAWISPNKESDIYIKFIEKLIISFRKKEMSFDCNQLLKLLTKSTNVTVLHSIECIAKDLRDNPYQIPTPTDFSKICYPVLEKTAMRVDDKYLPDHALMMTLAQWFFLPKESNFYHFFSSLYSANLTWTLQHRKQALECMIALGEQLTLDQKMMIETRWLESICLSTLESVHYDMPKSLAFKALFSWITPNTYQKVFDELKDAPLDNEWARLCFEKIGKYIDIQSLSSTKPDQMVCLISGEGAIENTLSQIWRLQSVIA